MYVYQRPTSWERSPRYPMADAVEVPPALLSTTNWARVALAVAVGAVALAAYRRLVKGEPLLAERSM